MVPPPLSNDRKSDALIWLLVGRQRRERQIETTMAIDTSKGKRLVRLNHWVRLVRITCSYKVGINLFARRASTVRPQVHQQREGFSFWENPPRHSGELESSHQEALTNYTQNNTTTTTQQQQP
jgi:hypothetical protein